MASRHRNASLPAALDHPFPVTLGTIWGWSEETCLPRPALGAHELVAGRLPASDGEGIRVNEPGCVWFWGSRLPAGVTPATWSVLFSPLQ